MEQIDQQPHFDVGDITPATFGARVAMLRQSLAEADPLAVVESHTPASAVPPTASEPSADALARAFHAALPAERVAILMRALDDAIVALDVAFLLADEFTGDTDAIQALIAARQQATLISQKGYRATRKKKYTRYENAAPSAPSPTDAPDATTAALLDAYTAFRETQPGLQGLYHYRNALAHYLRQPGRDIPPAPQTPQEETDKESASETEQ